MPPLHPETTAFPYELRPSPRARRLGATVYPGGHVVVTVPPHVGTSRVARFLGQHARWLMRSIRRLRHVAPRTALPRGKRDYAANKARALAYVRERVAHLNTYYGFRFGNISVKDTRSRWGSCSRKGNINFSYKLIYLPPEVADYVIVHELCHLAAFDHSRRFWDLVAETMPHHRELRKKLRTFAL